MADATSAPNDGARSLFGASGFAITRDGRRLHHVVAGTTAPGMPTVVFEAGMGSSRAAWALVQPAIAARTRAVVYDRSGHGRSERDPQPRTLARVAGDLIDLLQHLGGGPFVLVGHSWGGPIVRQVAAREPALVAGLVLVDPSDEGFDAFFAPATIRQQRVFAALLPALARTRLLRLAARSLARPLPPEAAAAVLAEDASLAGARTFQAELRPFTTDLRALRDARPPAPDVPLTIVSGTRPPRVGAALRAALVAAHERRVASAPLGRHVRAERSTHYVMLSEPELVVREILRVVDRVAASRGAQPRPEPAAG
jgi:pimeloyl-ACP methyl ester carboxylesterase